MFAATVVTDDVPATAWYIALDAVQAWQECQPDSIEVWSIPARQLVGGMVLVEGGERCGIRDCWWIAHVTAPRDGYQTITASRGGDTRMFRVPDDQQMLVVHRIADDR